MDDLVKWILKETGRQVSITSEPQLIKITLLDSEHCFTDSITRAQVHLAKFDVFKWVVGRMIREFDSRKLMRDHNA